MKYKMITCGPLGQPLNQYITQNFTDLIDASHVDQLYQKDLEGIDALAGFYEFQHLDLSNIKWIHSFGAGVDAFLKHPTLSKDLLLSRTLGYMDKRIGEYCLTYLLEDLKLVLPTYLDQQKSVWRRKNLNVLYDKKVLIYGTGFIGQGIANALSPHVKEVHGTSNSGTQKPAFDRVHQSQGLDLSEYDIIINALPLTTQTIGLFNSALFDQMENVVLLNVGRGKGLIEEDLIKAVEKGNIRKAILDVFQVEPLPEDSPLWKHPRVVVTPHQSGLTTFEDIRKSFDTVVKHIKSGTRDELFVDLSKGY